MKSNIATNLLVFILIFSNTSFSQEKVITFNLNILNIGYGYIHFEDENQFENDEKILFDNFNNDVLSINFIELETVFLDKVGMKLGLNIKQSSINSEAIKNKLLSLGNITVQETDYENGIIPIRGSLSPIYLNIGFLSKIGLKKIDILPSISYIYTLNSNRYKIQTKVYDNASSTFYTKDYYFQDKTKGAFSIGCDLRYQTKTPFYIGFRFEFMFSDLKGKGEITEEYFDGTKFITSNDYQRLSFSYIGALHIGINFSQ